MTTTRLLNELIAIAKFHKDHGKPVLDIHPLIEACAERHEQAQQTRLVIEPIDHEVASGLREQLLNIEAAWMAIEYILENGTEPNPFLTKV